MLKIYESTGEFYKESKKERRPVYIYGKSLDGRTFCNFLLVNGYSFKGFIDKDADYHSTSKYPEILAEDVPKDEEYYFLICAKTELIANEMIGMLKKVGVKGKIFTWKAFCINPLSYGGKESCSVMEFPLTIPYMYYTIYGNDVNKEFIKSIYYPESKICFNKKNYYHLAEYHSKNWNIDKLGMRNTVGQPDCERKIHFFGDSRILGVGVGDSQTIPSQLQKLINERLDCKYKVCNYSNTWVGIDDLFSWMKNIEIKDGDIVFFSARYFTINRNDKEILENVNTTKYYRFYINNILEFVKKRGAKFYFFITGPSDEVKIKTLAEKTMIHSINIVSGNAYNVVYNFSEIMSSYPGIVYDLRLIVDDNHLKVNFFIDRGHYSPEGCKIIASSIFEIVFDTKK